MQLINVISTLDAKTLQKAQLFFDSPYLNRSRKLSEAFKIIAQNIKKDDNEIRKILWARMFTDKAYNDILFRKLVHDILNKLMLFFSMEEAISSESDILRHQSRYGQLKGILELKKKFQRKLNKLLSEKDITKIEEYFDLYSAQRNIIDIEDDFTRKKQFKTTGEFSDNLLKLNNLLETVYSLEKIRLLLLQKNFNKLTGNSLKIIQGSKQEVLKDNNLSAHVLPTIYAQLYGLLIEDSSEISVKDVLEQLRKISATDQDVAEEIYLHLINYLGTKINQGEDFYQQWFEVLKFGFESKLLLRYGIVDPSDYRNMVLSACRLSEFEWALEFVDRYKQFLEEKYRQSAYSFSKARIFINMQRYEEVVDLLRDVEYEDITYNINSKLMLMHAFYELDEYDVLESTIKAFKVFLRRRRNISKSRKANFNDHCDVMYNLIKAAEKKNPARLVKARSILDQNNGIPNRSLLIKRIVEIEGAMGIKEEIRTSAT